jgi:hypothetical protein
LFSPAWISVGRDRIFARPEEEREKGGSACIVHIAVMSYRGGKMIKISFFVTMTARFAGARP